MLCKDHLVPTRKLLTNSRSACLVSVAWVNVNRGTEKNLTHVHEPGMWSGVYFVHGGPQVKGLHGHLIFRGGKRAHESLTAEVLPAASSSKSSSTDAATDGDAATEAAAMIAPKTTYTFMAVPPEPGILWLFPGQVPHCVFASSDVGDQAAHAVPVAGLQHMPPRISVAINFASSAPPPTRV